MHGMGDQGGYIDDLHTQIDDLRAEVEHLHETVAHLRDENDDLNDRISALQAAEQEAYNRGFREGRYKDQGGMW